jgi:Tol biopolymer transport system component
MSSAAHGSARLGAAALPRRVVARAVIAVVLGLLGLAGWAAWSLSPDLPIDARGTLVFVSDRSGVDSVYVRRLPGGRDQVLTKLDQPARDPALSPDGRRVAFVVGGRVGLVSTEGGPVHMLSLDTGWTDAAPAWRPDGEALVVSSRRAEEPRDIHLLMLDAAGDPVRRPLVETPYLDETQPVFSPDGQYVVFVREDHLYRADVGSGPPPHRLTGGFRKARAPRFLPSGRVLFLWTEGKEYGLDVIDIDGKGRETLLKGTDFYRGVAPSPDGRYLAATFAFDLAFHPSDALKLPQREEIRLLDMHGTRLAPLAGSWLYANHTADWGK